MLLPPLLLLLLVCCVLCVRLASSVETAASPAGWLSYCSTSLAEQEEEIGKVTTPKLLQSCSSSSCQERSSCRGRGSSEPNSLRPSLTKFLLFVSSSSHHVDSYCRAHNRKRQHPCVAVWIVSKECSRAVRGGQPISRQLAGRLCQGIPLAI